VVCARTSDGAAMTAAEAVRNERRLSPDMVSKFFLGEATECPNRRRAANLMANDR